MDSNTYIANALRTESVPTQLDINEVALHAILELAIAAGILVDQAKRRLYYNSAAKTVLLDKDKMLGALATLHGLSGFLGHALQNDEMDFDTRLEPQALTAMTEGMKEGGNFQLANLDVRLTHAALGCFTESGELLEAIKAQYETGIIDRVNFGEEIGGDISWYQAIGIDAAGLDLDDQRAKNIEKLRIRFPDKFSSENAITRDLTAERAALEGKAST
jgi:hypothetical protein